MWVWILLAFFFIAEFPEYFVDSLVLNVRTVIPRMDLIKIDHEFQTLKSLYLQGWGIKLWVAVAANRTELLVCLSIRLASYYPRWGVCGGCSCVGVIFVRETCEWNLSRDLALVLIVFVFWEYPTLTDDGTHYGRWSPTLLSSIWTHRNTWLMSHQINFLSSSLNLSISHFPPWKNFKKVKKLINVSIK